MTFMPRISTCLSHYFVISALLFSLSSTLAADDAPAWVTVNYVSVEEERTLSAAVEAVHQATISAQTSGRIVKINADVDDTVSKGDILIHFRNKEQKAKLNVAKAAFEEAEAEYNRIQDIYSKKLVAKAALDRASARFKSEKARLTQAKEAFENTIIRAPYSGIVVKRHIEVGEFANPGQKLMTGLSLEKLRAIVSLPQDLVHRVRTQNKATAILKNGQRLPINKITVSPYAEKESRSFTMRAELPSGDYSIYPGMFIKIAIVSGTKKSLLVPASSIARRSEVNALYIMKDNKLSFRQVRIGAFNTTLNSYEILAGLDANEKVMLDPVAAAAKLKLQE